jgi:hypothetical protein
MYFDFVVQCTLLHGEDYWVLGCDTVCKYSSTLKMEAVYSFEMSVNLCNATQFHIPEGSFLHSYRVYHLSISQLFVQLLGTCQWFQLVVIHSLQVKEIVADYGNRKIENSAEWVLYEKQNGNLFGTVLKRM